jgi:hypothetical protein
MRTIEFQTQLRPDKTLAVPDDVATSIPVGQNIRVLVLLDDVTDTEWEGLAASEFGQGYADTDSVYDLPNG